LPKTLARKHHHYREQSTHMTATEVPTANLSRGVEQSAGLSHDHHARELSEAMAAAVTILHDRWRCAPPVMAAAAIRNAMKRTDPKGTDPRWDGGRRPVPRDASLGGD